MNFVVGLIVVIGLLVAGILGAIAADPTSPGTDMLTPMAQDKTEPEVHVPVQVEVIIPEGAGILGCEKADGCYLPVSAELMPGDTVIWENADVAAHTATSGTLDSGPDGIFDSGILMAGGVFEYTFEDSGSYDYFCILHPWMTGQVSVN